VNAERFPGDSRRLELLASDRFVADEIKEDFAR